jgi:hypothetical protein
MKLSCHRSVGKGDMETEFGEFSGKTGGEAGAYCALEVIGAEVGIKDAALATSSGRTQCTRLSTRGEPKRLVRGGSTSSGIVSVASSCRRRHSRSSSAVLMPVPARPA